jgi:hypothetical protein
MNADIDHIGQRAEGQHGLVTGGDLDALGITRGRRRTLVARAILVPIGRGAHRFAGSPRTTLQAVTTACLAIGGRSFAAAGATALRSSRISCSPGPTGEVTESWLERQTLAILRTAGLPLPVCQQRIEAKGAFVARVDFFYELPRGRVVIEVSGHRHHRSRAQTTADAQRRRALTMAGCEVHEFTYDEIVRTPWVLVDTVRCILGLAVRAA